MDDDLLKTGEFAYLCDTTKETLRHYKDIGLLCPVAYADNGYAFYSPLQLSDFLLISSLHHAGCSLMDIKGYFADPDAEELDNVITERIDAITRERSKLLQQKMLLENTLARTRARHDWIKNPESYKLEVCDAEYFIDGDALQEYESLDSLAQEQAVSLVRHIVSVWDEGRAQGRVGELQGNYRVGLQAFLDDTPERDFHICTHTHTRKQARGTQRPIIEKPSGTYFKYLRVMNLADALKQANTLEVVFATYHDMKTLLDAEGFIPTSDVFERELSLYTGKTDDLIYSEVSVRVDKKDKIIPSRFQNLEQR